MPVRITEVVDDDGSAGPYSGAIHVEIGRERAAMEGSVDPESLRIILERVGR